MIKNRVFPMGIILIISSMTLHADIIDFYKKAVTTLQYNQEYSLKKEANKLNQKGVTYSRYANFSLNADYSKTEAKKLPNTPGTFNTTNITFNDTLDLFGKNIYKIDTLILNLKSQKSLLNMQKEQLFISLVNMITLYNKTLKQDSLYRTVFNEQKSIYVKLVKLQQQGAITSIDLLRFKNQLTVLKIKIMNQENEIVKMKKQLHAYAPNQRIPALKSAKLLYSEKEFLNKNPQLQFNSIEAQKLLVLSEGLDRSYLPDVTAGAAYQQIGDPTSYGNNYSFTVGLQIPINSGNFKESQALKVKALSLKSKNISLFEGQEFDFIISLCDKARQECKTYPISGQHIAWDFEDPKSRSGTVPFQATLNELNNRILMFVSIQSKKIPQLKIDPIRFYKCFTDEIRLKCLMLIQYEGELCVCELMAALDDIQPKVSRHLALLKKSELLLDRKQGQWVFYRINPDLPDWAKSVLSQTAESNVGFIQQNINNLTAMGNRPDRAKVCCQ